MLETKELRLLELLDTSKKRQEVIDQLEYAPQSVTNAATKLETIGLLRREREAGARVFVPTDTRCGELFQSLVKGKPHVDFPELLSPAVRELLYYLPPGDGRLAAELTDDVSFSRATVYRKLETLTNRAIVGKEHDRYRLLDEFSELHEFVRRRPAVYLDPRRDGVRRRPVRRGAGVANRAGTRRRHGPARDRVAGTHRRLERIDEVERDGDDTLTLPTELSETTTITASPTFRSQNARFHHEQRPERDRFLRRALPQQPHAHQRDADDGDDEALEGPLDPHVDDPPAPELRRHGVRRPRWMSRGLTTEPSRY